ncbi:hypothetical protein D3C78_1325250 [compost metagenome]
MERKFKRLFSSCSAQFKLQPTAHPLSRLNNKYWKLWPQRQIRILQMERKTQTRLALIYTRVNRWYSTITEHSFAPRNLLGIKGCEPAYMGIRKSNV